MRVAPFFAGILVCLWLFLSLLGWSAAGAWSRSGPRLSVLPFTLLLSIAAALALPYCGLRGGDGILLSFLLAFLPALLLAYAAGAWFDSHS